MDANGKKAKRAEYMRNYRRQQGQKRAESEEEANVRRIAQARKRRNQRKLQQQKETEEEANARRIAQAQKRRNQRKLQQQKEAKEKVNARRIAQAEKRRNRRKLQQQKETEEEANARRVAQAQKRQNLRKMQQQTETEEEVNAHHIAHVQKSKTMEAVLTKLRGKAEKEFQTEASLYVIKETSISPTADVADETGTGTLTAEESRASVLSTTSDHVGRAQVIVPSPSSAAEVASEERGTVVAVETSAVLRPVNETVDPENTKMDVDATDKTLSTSAMEKSRSSRRKPQKTHRVLESNETESRIYDQYIDEDLCDYMQHRTDFADSQPTSPQAGSLLQSEEKNDNDSSEETLVLPEGTVFVNPEAVDASPQILELESSRSRRTFRGNIETAIIHCTACNKQIGLDGVLDIHRHPILKVLICKKCYTTYNDTDIEQDAQGSDNQCRWCGKGGELICCDFCHNSLCKTCIRRNLGRTEVFSILNADAGVKWKCYVCDPKPLLGLIEHCTSIMEALAKQEKRQQELENRRRKNDSRSRAAINPPPPETIQGQPVSVIRAPSTSVMGRSTLLRSPLQRPETTDGMKSDMYLQASLLLSKSLHGATSRPVVTKNGSVCFSPAINTTTSKSSQVAGARPAADDLSMLPTLERLLSATHSMAMFLSSLKDELRRTSGTSTTYSTAQMQKRRDIASKLWKAIGAYGKSFEDANANNVDLIKKSSQALQVQQREQSTKSKMEVIELSDSDEESGVVGRSSAQTVLQVTQSCLQPVIVSTGIKMERQREDSTIIKTERPREDGVVEVQKMETRPNGDTETPSVVDARPSASASSNRRKRKNPQQVLNFDESPTKKPHFAEDVEENEKMIRCDLALSSLCENAKKTSEQLSSRSSPVAVHCTNVINEPEVDANLQRLTNGSCASETPLPEPTKDLTTDQEPDKKATCDSEQASAGSDKNDLDSLKAEVNGNLTLGSGDR